MSVLITFIICIFILLIIIITLIYNNFYVPYIPPTPLIPNIIPLSPWSKPTPVDGIYGKCNVYTFISKIPYIPVVIKFNDVSEKIPISSSTCVDDDQIFASKNRHTCQSLGDSIIVTGQCLQQDGKLVDKGTIEEYFQTCTPPGVKTGETTASTNNHRCNGSISLIAFNINQKTKGVDIFNGAMCMSSSLTIDQPILVLQQPCDTTSSYLSYPTQLFRVVRAIYKNKKFVIDQGGIFCQIVQRPSNHILAPTFTTGGLPILGEPLRFINSEAFWWVLVGAMSDPVIGNSQPQIVFIKNAGTLPLSAEKKKLFEYLIDPKNNIMSIQMVSEIAGEKLIMGKYIFTDAKSTQTTLAKINTTQYLDYSILPTIMTNPQKYNF